MGRLLTKAVLLVGLVLLALPSSLDAQRLGTGRLTPARPARIGPAFTPTRPAPFGAQRRRPVAGPHGQLGLGAFPGTPCIVNPSYADSFFCRQYFPRRGFSILPLFFPSFWNAPWEYPPEEGAQAPAPQPDNALAGQVEKLTNEVEEMREEQASSAAAQPVPAAPQTGFEEKPLAAILVYRDGHQSEAQNYAIFGRTLWLFGSGSTRRVPLADLDLQATAKVNAERGVDFVSLPSD